MTSARGLDIAVRPALGLPRLHLRRVGSTNARAKFLASAGAPHGTLVTASEQTAGRGRQGRTWTAPPDRALLMSLVIREPRPLLSLIAGVSVAQLAGADARVKWPNDVLLNGRKVAGILVEGRPQEGWSVLGIGINVALCVDDLPRELRARAGTLGLSPDDTEPTLERLLRDLAGRLSEPDEEVLAALRVRDALRGQAVRWDGGSGVAAGIDAEGRLLVSGAEGETAALSAGEVHLLPEG
jgi:BirA family biotin operon repressor/biotin-[acetyl-CoA-carboxylase] ligase